MTGYSLVLMLAIGGGLYGAATAIADPAPALDNGTEVLGQGEFRYRYRADKLVLPESITSTWQHVHGITLGPDNDIFVTYSTDGQQNEDTRALAHFDLDGNFLGTLGSAAMARGNPHGLDGQEEQGQFYLYHSNFDGRVTKTDKDGRLLWSFEGAPAQPAYENDWLAMVQGWIIDGAFSLFSNNLTLFPTAYMPCNVAFHPSEEAFYMADCYGSSLIHKFSTRDGSYQEVSFGGLGDQPGQFNTPHGLIYDPRQQQLLVADRGNSRLQYIDLAGNPVSEVTADAIAEPCDFDVMGEYLLIPDLSGHLVILDGNNQVVSKIEVAQQLGEQGVKYPHDAVFLPNQDIIVATWNPGTLTYWERVED